MKYTLIVRAAILLQGDSGGPLVCKDPQNGKWTVRGVTSWGFVHCGGPSVFTKVSAYRSWIHRHAYL